MNLFNYIFNYNKKYINNTNNTNDTNDTTHLISSNNFNQNNIEYEHHDNTCLIINEKKKISYL